jgi:hypothetical protein
MFVDNSLTFQTGGWSTAQAVTTTANGTVVVDVTGAGVGVAPAMINGFPALNTAIGYDMGLGDGEAIPYLYVTQTAAAGTGAGTVTISLSAAPDNGSYSPGTYTQLYASKAIVGSTLVAGDYIIVPVPPTLFFEEAEALPRFYQLTYTVSGTQTSSWKAGIVLNPTSSLIQGQYNNNFIVV